jgi:hypothetical protein
MAQLGDNSCAANIEYIKQEAKLLFDQRPINLDILVDPTGNELTVKFNGRTSPNDCWLVLHKSVCQHKEIFWVFVVFYCLRMAAKYGTPEHVIKCHDSKSGNESKSIYILSELLAQQPPIHQITEASSQDQDLSLVLEACHTLLRINKQLCVKCDGDVFNIYNNFASQLEMERIDMIGGNGALFSSLSVTPIKPPEDQTWDHAYSTAVEAVSAANQQVDEDIANVLTLVKSLENLTYVPDTTEKIKALTTDWLTYLMAVQYMVYIMVRFTNKDPDYGLGLLQTVIMFSKPAAIESALKLDAAKKAAAKDAAIGQSGIDASNVRMIGEALSNTPFANMPMVSSQEAHALQLKLMDYVKCRLEIYKRLADTKAFVRIISLLAAVLPQAVKSHDAKNYIEVAINEINELARKYFNIVYMIYTPKIECVSVPPLNFSADEAAIVNFREDVLGAVRIIVRIAPIEPGVGMARTGCPMDPSSSDPMDPNSMFYRGTCYGPFFKIFEHGTTNRDMFDQLGDTLNQLKSGYKISLFGYGYSGSGKTYTLFGKPGADGLAQLAIGDLIAKHYSVTLTRVTEYYGVATAQNGLLINEFVYSYSIDKNNNVTETKDTNVLAINIDNANFTAIVNALNEHRAEARRVTQTINNDSSSRSHLCITLSVRAQWGKGKKGTLVLVDMGGRENPVEIFDNTLISTDGALTLNSGANGKPLLGDTNFITLNGKKTSNAYKIGNLNLNTMLKSVTVNTSTVKIKLANDLNDVGIKMSIPTSKNPLAGPGEEFLNDNDIKLNKKRINKLMTSAESVIRTCAEGFYINETINNLTRRLQLAHNPDKTPPKIPLLMYPSDLNDSPAYNKALRKNISTKKLQFDSFIDTLLDNGERPSKLVMIACIRSEATAKYAEFNEKTLSFARDVASTVITPVAPVMLGGGARACSTRQTHAARSVRRNAIARGAQRPPGG